MFYNTQNGTNVGNTDYTASGDQSLDLHLKHLAKWRRGRLRATNHQCGCGSER